MKTYALAALLACTLAVPLSHAAEEEDHAGHHPGTDAADEASAVPKKDKMHAKMKKMQEQMEKIHESKDPEERQKLMQEHMESMREGMKAMRGMGKRPKGECPEEEGDGGTAEKGGMMGGMMKKHKLVEDRLDAMQKMIEQMLEHEAAEQEMEHGK